MIFNSDWTCARPEIPYPDEVCGGCVGRGCRYRGCSSCSGFGATQGRSRKSLSKRTGPTMRTTSGVCVPGASWLLFAPLLWAKTLENPPIPSIATKMPVRQRTEATRTRRLKKADCEVDFFFIDGVKFSLCGEPETVMEMLGEMLEVCQLSFLEIYLCPRGVADLVNNAKLRRK